MSLGGGGGLARTRGTSCSQTPNPTTNTTAAIAAAINSPRSKESMRGFTGPLRPATPKILRLPLGDDQREKPPRGRVLGEVEGVFGLRWNGGRAAVVRLGRPS